METINITIPDNLNPNQELIEIARMLGKKMLPPKNKMIGVGYEIKQLQTQIIIKREPIEKAIATRNCTICGTIVEQSISKCFYSNYGGRTTKHYCCSDDCRATILSVAGTGRMSIKKKDLIKCRSF